MKRLFSLIAVATFFIFTTPIVSAQGMMRGYQNPNTTDSTSSSTLQDEAAGKAVWDKLQSKQVTCSDLKDDDFDVLGDFFMGNMIGSNHDSMNQLMAQRLGEAGEKQMHITLGKRLSGCNANAAFPNGSSYFMPMMGFSGNGMMDYGDGSRWGSNLSGTTGLPFGVFGLITWLAVIAFLISGSVYFVRELSKKNSK